ncbi:hypothetical protein D3C79_1067720 [compost metagenome]
MVSLSKGIRTTVTPIFSRSASDKAAPAASVLLSAGFSADSAAFSSVTGAVATPSSAAKAAL